MISIFILIEILLAQTCPEIYQITNLQSTSILAYASGYNYLAIGQKESIVLLQCESGSYLRQISIPFASVLSMISADGYIIAGGQDSVIMYDGEQSKSIAITGKPTSLQSIGGIISVCSDSYENIIWNYNENLFEGRLESSIQNCQILYQIQTEELIFDSILIGSTNGITYLQYYSHNFQALIYNQTFPTAQQIVIDTVEDVNIIYSVNGNTISIVNLTNLNNIIMMSQPITLILSYQVQQIQVNLNNLLIFGVVCYFQTYNGTLSNIIIWNNQCQTYAQLIYNVEDSILITLMPQFSNQQEIIQIYAFELLQPASFSRSFYSIAESYSASYLLQSEYVIAGGMTTGNLYIYNQWLQLSQMLPPPVVNTIISGIYYINTLVIIQYSNNQLLQLDQSPNPNCLTGFTCYTYSVQITNQNILLPYNGLLAQLQTTFDIDNLLQITNSSEYIITTNGSTIFIYQAQNNQLLSQTTINGSYINQIVVYDNIVFILESNSYLISICEIEDLLLNSYLPIYYLQLYYYATYIQVQNQALVIISNNYIMFIQMFNYFNKCYSVCDFSQTFDGYKNLASVSMQNSFRSVTLLYAIIEQLYNFNINLVLTGKVIWDQIYINQPLNSAIQLTVSSYGQSSLIVPQNIHDFASITLQSLILEIATETCTPLTFLSINSLNIYNTFIYFQNAYCTYFNLSSVYSVNIYNYVIADQQLSMNLIFMFNISYLVVSNMSIQNNIISKQLFLVGIAAQQFDMESYFTNFQLTGNNFNNNILISMLKIQSSHLSMAQTFLNQLNISNNSFNQSNTIIGIALATGTQAQINNSYIEGFGILIMNYTQVFVQNVTMKYLNYNGIQMSQINHVNINLFYVSDTNYSDSTSSVIQVINQGLSITSLIQIQNLLFQNIQLLSSQLVYNAYGININIDNAAIINMSNMNFTNFILYATELAFSITSCLIQLKGYQVQAIITNSYFLNNYFTFSTSLMVMTVQSISISSSTFDSLQTISKKVLGTYSENGGIAQINAQYITLNDCSFSNLVGVSGTIFYIQTFVTQDILNSAIIFQSINVTNITAYGSGVFYIDNVNNYTNISISDSSFININAITSDSALIVLNGIRFSTNDSLLNIPTQLIFENCLFQDIYALSNNLFSIQYFTVILSDSVIQQQQYVNLGTFITALYCQVYFLNFSVQNIANSYSPLLISNYSQIQMFQMQLLSNNFVNSMSVQIFHSSNIELSFLNIVNNRFFNSSNFYIAQSRLSFTASNFTNNICNISCISGGLTLQETNASISALVFNNNRGSNGSGILAISQNQSVLINACQFIQNAATNFGGAIYANLVNTSIFNVTNSIFQQNSASQGGAIYSDSPISEYDIFTQYSVVNYLNNTFLNNQGIYGGALKTLTFNPYQFNNQFANNLASLEGSDISSYPQYIFLQQPLDNGPEFNFIYDENLDLEDGYAFNPINAQLGIYSLINMKPGDKLSQNLSFILKSALNQTMVVPGSQLQIMASSTVYSWVTNVEYTDQFVLQGNQIYGVPNSTTKFILSTSSVKNTIQSQYYFTTQYNYTFQVQLRPCLYGEIIQQVQYYTCYECPPKFYSVNLPTLTEFGQCNLCPANSEVMCEGGARMNVSTGYWRDSVLQTQVLGCATGISNCQGGNGSNLCGRGYTGALCQVCDYDNNYGRDTTQNCVLCDNVPIPYPQVIIISLGTILYLGMCIYFVAQDVIILCLIPCLNRLLPPSKQIDESFTLVQDLNSLMKIFLSYFQIVVIVKYVSQTLPFWSTQSSASGPSVLSFSLECPLLPTANFVHLPLPYIMYLTSIVIPLLTFAVFHCIFDLLNWNNYVLKKIYRSSTNLVLWLFFLPDYYKQTLNMLNCIQIQGISYVQADLDQICYSSEHFSFVILVVVPSLMLFVGLIPFTIFYQVISEAGKQSRPVHHYRFYYIIGDFRQDFCCWELLRLFEKLLVQTFVQIFQSNVIYMAESCLIVVMIYGGLTYRNQPYGVKEQNHVDIVSDVAAFTTIFIAMLIASIQLSSSITTSEQIVFYQLLIAIINAGYFVWMFAKILQVLLPVVFANYANLQKILAQYSCTRKYFLSQKKRQLIRWQTAINKAIILNACKTKFRIKLQKQQIKEQLEMPNRLSQVRTRSRTVAQELQQHLAELDSMSIEMVDTSQK